ncbi:hypothetical protein D3C81_1902720 [compost metagenome]
MNLAVDVGDIHRILIDQDNAADSGTGQGFNCHGTHTADPEHCYCAVLHNLQTFRSDRQLRTRELMQHDIQPPKSFVSISFPNRLRTKLASKA